MENNNRNKMLMVIIPGIVLAIMLGYLGMICVTQKEEKLKYNNTSGQEDVKETEKIIEEVYEQQMEFEKFTVSNVKQQTNSETTTNESEDEGEYLCEYSSTRYITEDDINELREGNYGELPTDKTILRMVVNELYAKYGYEFSNQEIQEYFEKKEWYRNITDRTSDMNEIFETMTEIERTNIDFLTQYDE